MFERCGIDVTSQRERTRLAAVAEMPLPDSRPRASHGGCLVANGCSYPGSLDEALSDAVEERVAEIQHQDLRLPATADLVGERSRVRLHAAHLALSPPLLCYLHDSMPRTGEPRRRWEDPSCCRRGPWHSRSGPEKHAATFTLQPLEGIV